MNRYAQEYLRWIYQNIDTFQLVYNFWDGGI